MLDSLDAAAVRRWCAVGLDALRRHQHRIDELNVYPVADRDTGTNLVLTLDAAYQAAMEEDPVGAPVGLILARMARAAARDARGNSGVIISELLRGIAGAVEDAATIDGRRFTQALGQGVRAGYAAVAEPAEGTMLSVANAAAVAADGAGSDRLPEVVRAAVTGAVEALLRTPDQLLPLARAGVVDAGGYGLVLFLQALAEVVTGEEVRPTFPLERLPHGHEEQGKGAPEPPDFEYEVQYLLDAAPSRIEELKQRLRTLGDSLVVAEATEPGNGAEPADNAETACWNVHVHVNDIGAAIEAGLQVGRPHRISVTRLTGQAGTAGARPLFADPRSVSRTPDTGQVPKTQPSGPKQGGRGVVVTVEGDGLAELLRSEGAVVVTVGPEQPATTERLLEAIHHCGVADVVVVADDETGREAADTAAGRAREEGYTVGVVPVRSPVQALAALAVRDPSRRFEDDVIAMAEAAGACRTAQLTVASREALTLVGRCRAGDVVVLFACEVVLIGDDILTVARDLLDRMLGGGGELVTLVTGAGAPATLADELVEHLRRHWPFVECQTYQGGQSTGPLFIGVE